jgi:hypothetical protein
MSMIDEYFSIYNNACKEYGVDTAVLYACGSFYEVYQYVETKSSGVEKVGNADKIAEVLHIVYTSIYIT